MISDAGRTYCHFPRARDDKKMLFPVPSLPCCHFMAGVLSENLIMSVRVNILLQRYLPGKTLRQHRVSCIVKTYYLLHLLFLFYPSAG